VTTNSITTATETINADDGQENLTDNVGEIKHREVPATKPTRQEAVAKLMAETGCTKHEARNTLTWLASLLDRARRAKQLYGQAVMHPYDDEMATRSYDIFDTVVPHNATPAPDSAHDIIGRHLLDASQGEMFLTHYQTEVGKRTFCNVEIGYQF
jgi:hypothetical protein